MGMVSPHFAGPIKAGGVQTGDGNVGDLGFGRYIGLLTAFFGQWLAPGLAKLLGIGLAFLTIMIGGDKADYDRAAPVLNHLGNRLYHLGPVGSGNFAKIANQKSGKKPTKDMGKVNKNG